MDRAKRAVEKPIEVDGDLRVGFSGGLAMAQRGDTAETLLRNADAALYAAKHRGEGTSRSINPASYASTESHRISGR